jgi:hypothetical protein
MLTRQNSLGRGKREKVLQGFDKPSPHVVYKGFWKASCSAVAVFQNSLLCLHLKAEGYSSTI